MTPLVWLCLSVALVAAVITCCWWGSNVVFHPPRMQPHVLEPEDFGLQARNVSFKTSDGLALKGWLIEASRPTTRTIIFSHGWGDNKADALRRFHPLHDQFNLFLFDSRAHGLSEGRFSTIGYLESLDFDAALKFLRENRPAWSNRTGLCGLSMGAAMAVYGMAHHPELKAAVLESPFRSFNNVVAQFTKNQFGLPWFPFVWLTLIIIRWRLGANPEPYSPGYHIAMIAPRPVLFIAGGKDRLMPLKVVKSLYERAREPKDIWVVPEASHGRCQEFAGDEYIRRIRAFFEKNL